MDTYVLQNSHDTGDESLECGDLSPLCLPNSAFSGVLQGGPKQRRWRFLLKSIGMTQVDGGATITRKKALTSHRTPKSACFRNELHRFLSRSKYRTCGGVGSTGPCTAPKASATFVRRLSGAYVFARCVCLCHALECVARPRHMFEYNNGLESKSEVTTTTESSLTLRLTYSVTVAYNPHQTVTGRSCKPRRSLHPRLFVIGTDEHPAFKNRY